MQQPWTMYSPKLRAYIYVSVELKWSEIPGNFAHFQLYKVSSGNNNNIKWKKVNK